MKPYELNGYEINYKIGDFGFVGTCGSFPEQYDIIYINGSEMSQVGYLRLRHGRILCYFPDINEELIYQYYYDKPIGEFLDEWDRSYHMNNIIYILKKKLDDISYGYS